MEKTIEIPEGYEARIDGNKVIIEKKESVDEKVRKELLAVIDDLVLPNEQRARFNAYLEKQKEQKPLSTEETELNSIAFLEQLGYTCVPPGAEQKPADVSEKIEELCSKYPLNKDVMSEQVLSAYHQGLTFGATKIAEYLGAQKPAEWSEEDERMLKAIIGGLGCIQKAGCERFGGEEMSDVFLWIKNRFKLLRSQPYWKPGEEQVSILGKVFAGCQLKDSERDSMVDLFYHLKDMI